MKKYDYFHFYFWGKCLKMWKVKIIKMNDPLIREFQIQIGPFQLIWTDFPF
jgi:hypothetical protein